MCLRCPLKVFIRPSKPGFSAIKAIIRDAYLIGDESSIKQFRVLVELVNNQNLCERLEKLPPVTETITFNSDRSQERIQEIYFEREPRCLPNEVAQ